MFGVINTSFPQPQPVKFLGLDAFLGEKHASSVALIVQYAKVLEALYGSLANVVADRYSLGAIPLRASLRNL
jgi:hypothetical protein